MSAPPRKQKIADEVYLELLQQILGGTYVAGDRLPPERELSTQLGTNRNTLREAIRRLEQARMVTVRQGQGVTVSDFRRTATIDILEAYIDHGGDAHEKARVLIDLLHARVEVLEYALELAVERADSSDIQRLAAVRQILARSHAAGDRVGVNIGYQQWLDTIVDAAHSLPVRWVANPFLEVNRRFMERFPELWVVEESFPDHLQRIERAVTMGDKDSARNAHREYYARIDGVVVGMLKSIFS